MTSLARRIAAFDWMEIEAALDRQGYATLPGLLARGECETIASLYPDDARFRTRVVMERHAFGLGEYKYLRYPLPPLVAGLRQACYPRLVPVANRWRSLLREKGRFPAELDAYLRDCHSAGQTRPTPLILKYEAGGYNCLHQDLYGELVFPLQMTVLLSPPGTGFSGGEFLLVEQRPRAQSKGEVVPLGQGDAVVFAVNHRPMQGKRGPYRVTLRHGVSQVRSGHRYTLGVIFHDAA
ncbi:MAG: 2OG-Fe(II) oxygenase [Stellaceae bacterium]